jgi:hypothetical protein
MAISEATVNTPSSKLLLEWVEGGDGLHRLMASSPNLMRAVVGGCGLSDKPEHRGEFWWNTSPIRGVEDRRAGYCPTLAEAKADVEAGLTHSIKHWRSLGVPVFVAEGI